MSVPTARRARVCAVALAGLLLAAGCGGGDATTDAGTPTTDGGATSDTADSAAGEGLAPDACLLITPADIAAALQLNVLEGKLYEDTGVTICAFEGADHFGTVEVSRFEPVGDLIKNTLAADPAANELAGVGDEAVEQIALGQVTVRMGDVGVVISSTPDPELDGLVQLARIAVGSEARERAHPTRTR